MRLQTKKLSVFLLVAFILGFGSSLCEPFYGTGCWMDCCEDEKNQTDSCCQIKDGNTNFLVSEVKKDTLRVEGASVILPSIFPSLHKNTVLIEDRFQDTHPPSLIILKQSFRC